MAPWSWGGGAGAERGALPGPAGPAAGSRRPAPSLGARGCGLRAPTPLAPVSLTHGLRHLQLLVEPLAQDLRHGWAWASDSTQGNQATASRPLVAKGNPLLRKRLQAGARRKARRRGATEPRRGGRETVACPLLAGMTAKCAGARCSKGRWPARGPVACEGTERLARSRGAEVARQEKLWTERGVLGRAERESNGGKGFFPPACLFF